MLRSHELKKAKKKKIYYYYCDVIIFEWHFKNFYIFILFEHS